jgi:hypothetical protein
MHTSPANALHLGYAQGAITQYNDWRQQLCASFQMQALPAPTVPWQPHPGVLGALPVWPLATRRDT